ncbi:MAG: helix-turn-helix domain-containing protein, partial [Candidatus Pacebacteria bacterium]|nr:helix-turn-helix domain-containing protein [Candidatus Paceibacterota bacterium]
MALLTKNKLISTKEASELSGYHPDYLARLCRTGKIGGMQVGRTWLVESDSLSKFVREQAERKKKIAEELSEKLEKEYKTFQTPVSTPRTVSTTSYSFANFSVFALSFFIVGLSALTASSGVISKVAQVVVDEALVASLSFHSSLAAFEMPSTTGASLKTVAFISNTEVLPEAVQILEGKFAEVMVAGDPSLTFLSPAPLTRTASVERVVAVENPGLMFGTLLRDGVVSFNKEGVRHLEALVTLPKIAVRAKNELLSNYELLVYGWVTETPRVARSVATLPLALGDASLAFTAHIVPTGSYVYTVGVEKVASALNDAPAHGAVLANDTSHQVENLIALVPQYSFSNTKLNTSSLASLPFGVSGIQEVTSTAALLTYQGVTKFFNGFSAKVASYFSFDDTVRLTVVSEDSFVPEAPVEPSEAGGESVSIALTNEGNSYYTTISGISNEVFVRTLSAFKKSITDPVYASFYAMDERIAKIGDRVSALEDGDTTSGGGSGGALSGTTLTVTGNGSVGGTFQAGTTTVSGGLTVTGDAAISGALTVGSFSVSNLSVTGSISAPTFNATSTTATSTFSGGFVFGNAVGNSLSVNSFVATTSTISNLTATNAVVTNGTTTNATSTNLSVSNALTLTGLTPSRLVMVNGTGIATSTNLSSWISGTTDQITVTDNSAGGIALSLPTTVRITNASTTALSSNTLAVGQTGTTTISSTGALYTPTLTVGALSGILKATAGVVSTSLISLTSDVSGTLPVSSGGTGTGTAPTYGQLLVGNGSGGYTLTSTSSLGIVGGGGGGTWGSITGTLSDQTDLQSALDAKLSLTSWYATTTDGLDEGSSNLYYTL